MWWNQSQDTSGRRVESRIRAVMTWLIVVAFLGLVWAGRAKWGRTPPPPKTVVLYGFSIMEEVMEEAIFPAFQESWQERSGERVEMVATFAGSGAVTGKIIERFPAEIAILSSKLDVQRLVESGVSGWPPWDEMPHGGILTRSPLVILVREGNPRAIVDFSDLASSGTSVLHADPTTSGLAKWSILAEYGSALARTGDPELAFAQLLGVWKNVTGQAASAQAARGRFEEGEGDALITYEQNVMGNRRRRIAGEIVYPPNTVMTEHTAVKLVKNVADKQQALVDGLLEFLWSRRAQEVFVEYGFRSPIEELNQARPSFGPIPSHVTLDRLGGPIRARREILEDVWRERVLPQLDAVSR